MKKRVQAVLDKIRPSIQADGGDVVLVDVNEETKIAYVKLTGACVGCPMSQMTLKAGIERIVKSEVPEIVAVEAAQ